MPRSRQLSALLIVFALALASCTDDGENDADPQPTTTQPSTTTTESPEAEDEQALRQLAEDWNDTSKAIYLDESLDVAEAEQFLVDPYLAGFVDQVEAYRADGRSSRPGDASRHVIESVSIDGDTGTVTECIVNGEVLLDRNGEVLDDSVLTARFDTVAVRVEDGWRFEDRSALGGEEEGDRCPE